MNAQRPKLLPLLCALAACASWLFCIGPCALGWVGGQGNGASTACDVGGCSSCVDTPWPAEEGGNSPACSLAVALSGLGFTASADSPQLQTYLALARAQKALGINCPATPDCPVPCTVLERGKMQVKSNADCPPCPKYPDVAKAAGAKKLSKCPPSPACLHC